MLTSTTEQESKTPLKKSIFLAKIYGLEIKEIQEDYERVRDALADAIVKVHPENTGGIPIQNKLKCSQFLSNFNDIFTVNYDLLLYWVLLQGVSSKAQMFGDYFYRDEDTPQEYCEYLQNGGKSKKHVLFLHGALHLFLEKGITTKKVWGGRMPLIKQIKTEIENGYYPLVVAEGDHVSKLNQIKTNPYLNHAFSNFTQKKGSLFSFETNLTLKSSLGNANIEAILDRTQKNNEKYTVNTIIENLNLGTLLKNKQFGKVTANAIVNGTSLNPANINATLTSNIIEIQFNNYKYQNIAINGDIKKEMFTANTTVTDPNLTFVMDTKCSYKREKPTLDLNLNLSHRLLSQRHLR